MKESQSYQSMLNTVQTIVKDIADPDLDLDLLVNKVETGYDLIQSMRQRLDETKEKIEQLHSKYTETDQQPDQASKQP